jgi:hypothetical protein
MTARERKFSQQSNSDDKSTERRVCRRCGGEIEPERKRRPATRYCRPCALANSRERVSDWKRRKIAEIGREEFRRQYSLADEKRRDYMRDYMRRRRERQHADALAQHGQSESGHTLAA